MEILGCEITLKKQGHQKIASQLYSQTYYVVLQTDIKHSKRNGSLLSTQ